MAWSDQIADRYRCALSPVLADWFDREIWKESGFNEYREPASPECLLSPKPEMIWPVLMGPDLLPVVGNTVGDWLCVQVGPDDRADTVVQWYHGGGDWIPWGNNLAEAIVFEALSERLPGPQRRHAIPAENPKPANSEHAAVDPLLSWALEHMPGPVVDLFQTGNTDSPVEVLLSHQIAEVAVRCQLVQAALNSTSLVDFDINSNDEFGIASSLLAQWMFDPATIADEKRELIRSKCPSILREQDWEQAEQHARRTTELAPSLAWGWDIAAYACERRGDLESAKSLYLQASECSVFTDQSIRLQTHWAADRSAKFSVARLLATFPDSVRSSPYLQILCDTDANQRVELCTSYWLEQAKLQQKRGDSDRALQFFVAAGWDLGAQPMDIFVSLLEEISSAAEAAGQQARSALARTHLDCLRERYSS